jgi:DcuC family C4-dicarboxylate transporter
MPVLGPVLACAFIVVVAWALLRGFYPHAVLLLAGMAMLIVAGGLGMTLPPLEETTRSALFDLARYVAESFAKTLQGVGLMIMAIGGFVAYMEHIGASRVLVRLATRPLQWFRRYPYTTSSLLIPVGQALFVCIPSAAGLGLLLMASVFPLIVQLGVSRLSAVSVIVACTSFGIGPASAISVRATQIAETSTIGFFFSEQLPLVIPMSLVMAVCYFFVNRAFDRSADAAAFVEPGSEQPDDDDTPPLYAIFPVLPLVLLLVFSELFQTAEDAIRLDTTTAMFISMGMAALVDGLRTRDFRAATESLKVFWSGMANIFKSVVTLIIAADLFSKGLMGLGFIEALLDVTTGVGFGIVGVGVVMTVLIFLATMLMGSGNASFFAFGPLVPGIAQGLGASSSLLILPMHLAASMGRSVSPIAGVVIATAQVADVPPLAVARRNFIPLGCGLVMMLLLQFLIGRPW